MAEQAEYKTATEGNSAAAGVVGAGVPTTDAKYSTRRPAATNPDVGQIPDALKELDQWVLWRWFWVEPKNGHQGKWTKVPYQANGDNADSTNPATWTTFAQAFAALRVGKFDGIGITCAGGLAGVDLDNCLDGQGQPSALASSTVARLNTYTERTPSGVGLRCLCWGSLPVGGRKNSKLGVEMYDTGRFFTITGLHLEGTPATVEQRAGALAEIHAEFFPAREPRAAAPTPTPTTLDDDELIAHAERAANGQKFTQLYRGNWQGAGYGSQSEADLALCGQLAFWTGGDTSRIDRIFRSSGLMRDKWNERHSGNGASYGALTVARAIEGATDFYTTPRTTTNGHKPHDPGDVPPDQPPPDDQVDELPKPQFAYTDMGNGQRLAERHADKLRYVTAWGWTYYDGRKWAPDNTGAAMRLAKATTLSILEDADAYLEMERRIADQIKQAGHAQNDAAVKALLEKQKAVFDRKTQIQKWAMKSQEQPRLKAMLSLAESEPGMVATPEQFDTDPLLFNAANCTIDLRTGQARPHDPADMLTKCAGADYDPAAPCPTWLSALRVWMANDDKMIAYLKRACGLTLTGLTWEQVLFFLYGNGKNGKTKFSEALFKTLGDYARKTHADTLLAKRNDGGISNDVAALKSARLVLAAELPEGRRLNEALVKDMTGDDTMTARFLHKEFFDFRPQFKLWMYGNHKPEVRGTDEGIWRRFHMIPFTVQIPEEDRDVHLGDKLAAELAGILAWAVEGCMDWQRIGLQPPAVVIDATKSYRAEQDELGGFIGECCIENSEAAVSVTELYQAYQTWGGQMSKRTLGRSLADRGYTADRKGPNGGRRWTGLGLPVKADNDEQR